MINTKQFTLRLQKVIEHYNESASSFADKLGVQRSSISHIMSGRNKPSLDFIMKVLHSYPEVDLYWLMNGKGHFPPDETNQEFNQPTKAEGHPKVKPLDQTLNLSLSKKEIDQIIVFYRDGSFKKFMPVDD